ncbi:hypothetical protein IFM53868_07158 [Aspergillus udagawae]|uniref:Uncharacterized protein n=1 Tax=Aspergillus udagawae TaxID=91492 RepID=A0ABQ1B418_9EURO|nr:hypothetical protein IFM53868_07158 [Aspergillus udagawae]
MASESLSEDAKQIVGAMRELIENKIATKEEKVGEEVWKYAGKDFSRELTKLEREMSKDGKKVIECNAYHCVRGANIKNPTGGLFLIPVNGTPTLIQGDPLLPGSSYFFENQASLFGDRIDIVTVVLANNKK